MNLFQKTRSENQYVISYMTLRRAVGWLGIALPIVLIGLKTIFYPACPTPPSISHYYYTQFGSFFTGTLCAVALFLFAYNGPAPIDRIAAFFAACCALGVVFNPANPCDDCHGVCYIVDLGKNCIRNSLHYSFAALLFLTFAFFSLCLFTRTYHDKKTEMTDRKKQRNGVFIACGIVILVSIACIGALKIPFVADLPWVRDFRQWTFVFEALALIAFGTSWLVKGQMILGDRKPGDNY